VRKTSCLIVAIVVVAICGGNLFAEEAKKPAPATPANVEPPAANTPNEPLAEFSAERGKQFLDAATVSWQKQRDCIACHTGYLYLVARPTLGANDEAHLAVRQYTEELVSERWPVDGPRWDTEVAMTALGLAYNDAQQGKPLHAISRQALDKMWTVQREDGGIQWISCGWPPFELDDEYGATMMALAVSVAPDHYADSEAAKAGIEKLKQYFVKTPLPTLHHWAMLLWADTYRPLWLDPAARQATLDELLALQHADGGWSIASLGNWKRADGSPQDTEHGDGYATGLAIYLARRSGIAASDERLARGIAWLKQNQRASGRWFTRSLHKDSKHYLTHAGSNMAMMALAECDALESPASGS